MAFFKPPVNYRSAASRTPTPEPISVVSGVALLAEAPADPGDVSTPMAVTVGGVARTRVTSAPSVGQFMVRAATSPQGVALLPVLEFHASDEGLNGTCDYYRTGTVYTAEWFSFLLSFVTPLTGIASKAALDATYPATPDATQHGRPGRMAFLADYSAWFSDGVEWRQLTGTAAAITAVDALYAASFGVTSDAVASHVGAMTAALTAGASLDGVWAPPGVLAGDLLAAVTLAAALDAAWVPGGLAGAFTAAATLSDARDAVWAAGGGGAGITYVGAGTVAYNAGAANGSTLSVPLPAGIASGDLLLIVYGAGTSAVPAAPAGWTDSAAVFAGAAFVAGNACWKRAGSSETAPAIGVFGDDGEGPVATANVARMYAFRGVVASGSPFDAAATFAFGSGTAVTGSARTTATANAMIVMAGGHATANTTYSTPGASVDTLIEAHGSTYGIFLAYDDAPSNSAGAKAAPTAVQSASVAWGVLSFALKPA